MKKFLKNLLFGINYELKVSPIMYKQHKWCEKLGCNPDRCQCNGQECVYIYTKDKVLKVTFNRKLVCEITTYYAGHNIVIELENSIIFKYFILCE